MYNVSHEAGSPRLRYPSKAPPLMCRTSACPASAAVVFLLLSANVEHLYRAKPHLTEKAMKTLTAHPIPSVHTSLHLFSTSLFFFLFLGVRLPLLLRDGRCCIDP